MRRRSRPGRRSATVSAAPLRLVVALVVALIAAGCGGGQDEDRPVVGLITKQEENPYWVTMRQVAEDAAAEHDVELLTATGESDVDVQSQVTALQEMTEQGADGILIAPTDSSAVVPAIERARDEGVTVIAVDTPVEPAAAVDAVYATDNERAGRLIGEYARAAADEAGFEPRVAMLDLAPGITSGEQRREGFLRGFGAEEGDPQIVASESTEGNQDLGRRAMEQILESNPDVNVVYTVNEPAAIGALEALEAAGLSDQDVVVVSVDGGCEAIKNHLRPGSLDATAQQFPQNMARVGVEAIAEAARGGEQISESRDTGAELITGDPVEGVDSRDVAFGVRNCWG